LTTLDYLISLVDQRLARQVSGQCAPGRAMSSRGLGRHETDRRLRWLRRNGRQSLECHLDLRDRQFQLFARSAKLPTPQSRQLDLQALDLQLLCLDRAVALREELPQAFDFRSGASVGHASIIRVTLHRARVVGELICCSIYDQAATVGGAGSASAEPLR